MTIAVDDFNALKTDLANARRVSEELLESLKLWKEKCSRLEAERDKERLRADSKLISNDSLVSQKVSSRMKRKSPSCLRAQRGLLLNEIGTFELPDNVQRIILALYDKVFTRAHQFSCELVPSGWHSIHSRQQWPPNEITDEDCLLYDWRGRSLMMDSWEPRDIGSEEELLEIPAPLVHVLESVDGDKMILEGVYYPLCPFSEARRGETFTFTHETLTDFIGQSALHDISLNMSSKLPIETEKNIFLKVCKSLHLKARFFDACKQSVATRKMAAKEIYFCSLGYGSFGERSPTGSLGRDEMKRKNEINTAYQRMFKMNEEGERDTSFWRTAKFSDVCNTNASEMDCPLTDVGGIDTLFGNEAARLAYKQFRKFAVNPERDATAMTIIRLDAMMTAIVDGFASVSSTGTGSENLETTQITARNGSECDGGDEERYVRNRKGGKSPMDASNRYRKLLPLAAAQFLVHARNSLESLLSSDSHRFEMEMKIGGHGDLEQRLHNAHRQHTIAFKYPPNGHFYIALRASAFKNVVCSWIGLVSDCYILKSKSLEHPLTPFQNGGHIETLLDDDETDDEDIQTEVQRATAIHTDDVGYDSYEI